MVPFEEIKTGFETLINKIKVFEIMNEALVPEGLKPHTRSICWIAEQVILQNLRKHKQECGFIKVEYPDSDIDVWDCAITLKEGSPPTYINVKVNNVIRTSGRNDISKAPSLVSFYSHNRDANLLDVVIRIKFENTKIHLNVSEVVVFNVAWIPDIYVNPSNHHLQAEYSTDKTERTNREFVELLKKQLIAKNIKF